jgi:hypothetical protein
MHFECISGLINAAIPVKASSFPSPTDVGTIMSGIAKTMGYGFENNGVNITLPPSYFPGAAQDQWRKVAQDAGIRAELVPGSADSPGNLILAIWPKGGSRGGAAPLVSPTTGMIGYPEYTQQGISVKTIYNPQIAFGGKINVQSSLFRATGTWVILRLDHALDTLVKDGQWESSMWCFNPAYPLPNAPAA